MNYDAEFSASWEHRSGQPGVQLWSVQPDEDQLQLEAPKSTGAGANSRLIPSAFCVSDNHAFLTGSIKVKHVPYSFICFGFGVNWVSGAGSRKVELAPKKEKIKKSHLKSLNVLCRGLRRHTSLYPVINFYKFCHTNIGLDPDWIRTYLATGWIRMRIPAKYRAPGS